MQEYTRRLFREVWWAVTPALVFAGMATLALTVSLSVLGRRDGVVYAETKVATHVIDYTAADGAPNETYTDAGPLSFPYNSMLKLSGTEDSEAGTWYIPLSRIEEIDP